MIKKIAIASLGLLPLLTFAQTAPTTITAFSSYSGIIGWIGTLTGWMLGILIAVSVIFFVYAAYLYLVGAGDEEKITKAKNYIIYAVIALVVGLLAKTIPVLLGTILGDTAGQTMQ